MKPNLAMVKDVCSGYKTPCSKAAVHPQWLQGKGHVDIDIYITALGVAVKSDMKQDDNIKIVNWDWIIHRDSTTNLYRKVSIESTAGSYSNKMLNNVNTKGVNKIKN